MSEKKKYQNIQILRIAACMGTFFVHFGQRMELSGILRGVTDLGAYGVYMFFLISGFVAFFSLDNSKKAFSAKKYLSGRLIRIVPVYYLVIAYYFVLNTIILKDVPVDTIYGTKGPGWFRYLFFLNIILPYEDAFWDNLGATWTIKIFVLFYLLVPILKKWITNSQRAFLVWGIMYVLGIMPIPFVNMQAIGHLHYLLLGVLLYFCMKERNGSLLVLGAAAYTLLNMISAGDWRMVIFILLFSICILVSLDLKIENKVLIKLIDKLDEYSYAVYLVHAVFIDLADRYKGCTGGSNWRMGAMLIMIAGTGIGCIVVHELFEKPVQTRWKKL